MKRLALFLALSLGCHAAFAQGFDWPQWQGPDRTAVSKETGLLKQWPTEGPPLKWRAKDLGTGYSAPAVFGGKVYFMAYKDKNEVLTALNEADGTVAWTQVLGPAPAAQAPGSEGSSSTPAVDDGKLYMVGIAGDVFCVNLEDHKVIWKKSFTSDFGAKSPMWNFRESPLIDGEKVIVTPGGPGAAVVALNKKTGETIWKAAVPGDPGAAYASCMPIEVDGVRQYVAVMAKTVVGIAAADGKFLWKYEKLKADINCNTAVYQDGLVLLSTAYDVGAAALKLSKNADGSFKAEEVWFTNKMQIHHGGLIALNGVIYGANGGNSGGYLEALDLKTGKVLWDEGAQGKRRIKKGSLAFADGRLYYYTEDGEIVLFEPSDKDYLERGRFKHPDRSKSSAWTHPVIANGKLFIRDQENMFCYDVKAK